MASPAQLFGMASLALLLGWATWEASWKPGSLPPPQSAELLPSLTPMTPLRFGALSDYPATLERPLFFPDRRLPGAEQTTAAAESDTAIAPRVVTGARPTLRAVIVEGEQRSALLQQPGELTSTRVRIGERIGDWRLIDIEQDGVTLELDGRRQELPLREFDPAPAVSTPSAPARQHRLSGGVTPVTPPE